MTVTVLKITLDVCLNATLHKVCQRLIEKKRQLKLGTDCLNQDSLSVTDMSMKH